VNTAIYNEHDPFAAAWTRNLIAAGHVAPGVVDERSIEELTADDVAGPGQRHFFSGIAGWSYALRLAGIPNDADVWTGSCPCQPFSSAGKRGGTSDARHLWPAWFALIEQCRPPVIFGEQVASIDGLAWLDIVFADLERCGYAVGAADLCAASVGAPHIRQRFYFVAYADSSDVGQRVHVLERQPRREVPDAKRRGKTRRSGGALRLGDSDSQPSGRDRRPVSRTQGEDSSLRSRAHGSGAASEDVDQRRMEHHMRSGRQESESSPRGRGRSADDCHGGWSGPDVQWIDCTDGKRRPIPTQSALFPLATGIPNRVGMLRGSGNAIVPQVAAAFIQAAYSAKGEVK
jgi:DNA (cytosine-5)-methyltransferase 1